jgi:hypothetical protein
MSGSPGCVRKVMSASDSEFAQSLGVLLGRPMSISELPLQLALGSGHVVISRELLPGVRLGGLLEMPRAAVTLTFQSVDEAARARFIQRFDLAFQRGGG